MRALVILALLSAILPTSAAADGSWLDQPLANWNQPGMDLPQAPPMDPHTNPRCIANGQDRPPETPADQALVDNGWTLFSGYLGGWNTLVVRALSGYDGMCRPLGFNVYVFVDGQFAGTVSPDLMDSRVDGVGDVRFFATQDRLTAQFQRYAPADPLCCPSGHASVSYRLTRTASGPLLVPEQVSQN